MSTLQSLRNIAEDLGLNGLVAEIEDIEFRSCQENANLFLPLVGEFSSGKTTLINALTDSKKLETATKPTTATIYEIHFGCETCHAKVVDKDGKLFDVDNIADLKNEALADAKVVTVFDTSKKVPSTTILLDTPGLSSPDPKHKQTLVDILPKADGILLVSDINQQITKSLTDFIETMKLSKRPIFLILTKSDTKSLNDIAAVRANICNSCQIPISQMAVVSATKDNMEELYSLLLHIQEKKKEIITRVDKQRENKIVEKLIEHIEELMKASSSDEELTESIRHCQYEIDKINRNIDRIVDSMSNDIEEHQRTVCRKFEDNIYSKLTGIVTACSTNYDNEAVSTINGTASLLMNEYREGIREILRNKAKDQRGSDGEVPLSSLDQLDLSSVQMTGLNYNLDLNSMGHQYDGMIKFGVIASAAVGGAIALASCGVAAGAAAGATTAINAADTVTDIGSMVSNRKTVKRIEKAVNFTKAASSQYGSIEGFNKQVGQQTGNDKGIIDSFIGFVTDKFISKPQRSRAIHSYIDSSLMPIFKMNLNSISAQLVSSIRESLHQEASEMINQKTSNLNQLKEDMAEHKDAFNKRIEQLREYKTVLLTL